MLIEFTVENWMSFNEKASFSMVASKERQHSERLARIKKYRTRLLPVAAIYGGNASGKTNFFKALNFVKTLVVRGIPPDGLIPVDTYLLDSDATDQPARFSCTILAGDTVYEYSFAVTATYVIEESLVNVTSSSEKVLFARKQDSIELAPHSKQKSFLEFVGQGTRNNQLFLHNSISQNANDYRPVYDWFRTQLVLIAPDYRFSPFDQFIDEDSPLYEKMREMLFQLDTGISRLGSEKLPFESLNLPESEIDAIFQTAKEQKILKLVNLITNERVIVSRQHGKLNSERLVTYHKSVTGEDIKFSMKQESDGTQRIFDLLPAFLDISLTDSSKVVFIDELDRSLHTQLTRSLISFYLSSCKADSRTQLIFTTHDLLLMDQDLLRRDEMWVAERNATGNSSLISLGDYKELRFDKDIRRDYLVGRMGGVPNIMLSSATRAECMDRNGKVSNK